MVFVARTTKRGVPGDKLSPSKKDLSLWDGPLRLEECQSWQCNANGRPPRHLRQAASADYCIQRRNTPDQIRVADTIAGRSVFHLLGPFISKIVNILQCWGAWKPQGFEGNGKGLRQCLWQQNNKRKPSINRCVTITKMQHSVRENRLKTQWDEWFIFN